MRRLEKYRPNIDPRGSECALKLVVKDEGGRRRLPLSAKAMLVVPHSKQTGSHAVVAYPATGFALRAAKFYRMAFGARKAARHRMEPLTARESATARLEAEKPRLAGAKRKNPPLQNLPAL